MTLLVSKGLLPFIVLFIYLLFIIEVASLSCGPCLREYCAQKHCPTGLTLDQCKCCYICAKGLDELCGGFWDLKGKCADGLECTFSPILEGEFYYLFRTGVCRPNLNKEDENTLQNDVTQ